MKALRHSINNVKKSNIKEVIDYINELNRQDFNIFLLYADLGVGKTYLIDSYIKSKNIDGALNNVRNNIASNVATSPSFSFIHEYFICVLESDKKDSLKQDFTQKDPAKIIEPSEKRVYHYDLYLKNDPSAKAKLLESLCLDGLHFIEWGDKKLLKNLQTMGFKAILIEILECDDIDSRIYNFFTS